MSISFKLGSAGKIKQTKLGEISSSGGGIKTFNVAAVYPKYQSLKNENFCGLLGFYVNVKRQERDYINVHMEIKAVSYDRNTGILSLNVNTWNTGSQHAQPIYKIPIFIFTSG